MKQFKTILKFELKDYFRDKIFVGITIFLVVAIAVVMFIPNIKSAFGSASEEEGDLPVMLIAAEDAALAELALPNFKATFTDYDVRISNDSTEDISAMITREEISCAFVMTSPSSCTYYVNNLSLSDSNAAIASEVLTSVYRMNAMLVGGLDADEVASIMSTVITAETVNLGKNQAENFFYTYIMIFALYLVILLYGQMVATSVATEKSSRAMELLITSAKPISMMFGKVIAACTAGLCQILAVFGSAILFYNINESAWSDNPIIQSIFNIPPELLVYMLIYFILGFVIYAFLYGAIGSTVSKLEDINTAVMPITLIFVAGFMIVMYSMGSGSVDNTVIQVCSYIPFTSPMAMFTRIAMSTVPFYEILISIIILIGSVIGIGVLSARIYRVGVLLYGTKPNLIKTIKSVIRG